LLENVLDTEAGRVLTGSAAGNPRLPLTSVFHTGHSTSPRGQAVTGTARISRPL